MHKLTSRASCAVLLALGAAACLSVPLRDALPDSPWQHPYYELDRIKALTLEELDFHEVKRTTIEGVEVITGTYSGFDQGLALADGSVKTIRWRQGAALFLPPRSAMTAATDKAVLYNGHFVFSDPIKGFTPSDRSVWGFELNQKWGIGVAKAYGIPVLIHGYEPLVVKDVEGTLYHDLQSIEFQRLLDRKITRAEDMPLDGRYLINGWPLAKGDMVSITLLQRLVERERGAKVREVGSLGISKEGGSHWILGAADDRVAVLAPGGSAHQSWDALMESWRTDFGSDTARFGYGPALDELLRAAWRLGDWLTTTEAGRKVDRLISPTYWIDRIHARHILVTDDLGTRAQHDTIWPLLSQNPFYERLFREHRSVRHVRAFDGSGLTLSDSAGEMSFSLLPSVAELLVHGPSTPTTPTVSVEENGRRLRFGVSTTLGAGGEVLLLHAVSADRSLRLEGTKWEIVPMAAAGAGKYQSPWLPAVPEGQALSYIAVAREPVQRGELRFWRSAASLPREHFPRPKLDGQLPDWREAPAAPPASTRK
jgi:hypothetical protein